MRIVFQILLFFLLVLPARADVSHLTEQEFRELAQDLAPKVNLFRDAWEQDPHAVFYGGTSRDYLYWLKGKFLTVGSRDAALKLSDKLRKQAVIDVREFIIGESDVDVISSNGVKVEPAAYGVRKVDSITADIFDPSTDLGKNELWQGHVPVEKIQISRHGITQNPALGDGLHELYTGKLSVHFPDPKKFAQTKYAKEGLNHPVLLALRYLRLQGINYFRTHGQGLPDKNLLFSGFEEKSFQETKKVISSVMDGKALRPYLKQNKFSSWLNGTIQKSFRSYTNPTAALEILKSFEVDKLSGIYGEKEVEPIYQYVFAQYRDEAAINKNLSEYGVNQSAFFANRKKEFTDGFLYHGTNTEEAFRSILFQGVMPSTGGSSGKGLYGVAEKHRQFSEKWAGDKNRLLKFPVLESARIVDITQGEGKRIFKKFGGSEEEFAQAFGVDIIRYPYNDTEAYVVKNSSALGHAEGVYRQIMPVSALMDLARKSPDPESLIQLIWTNQVSNREAELILREANFPESKLLPVISKLFNQDPNFIISVFRGTPVWQNNAEKIAPLLLGLPAPDTAREALALIGQGKVPLTDDVLLKVRGLLKGLDGSSISSRERYLAMQNEILNALAEHKNWPRLLDTVNALARGADPDTLVSLKMIARVRLKPEELLRLNEPYRKVEGYRADFHWDEQRGSLPKTLLQHPDKKMAKELSQAFSAQPMMNWPKASEDLMALLAPALQKWKDFPEVPESLIMKFSNDKSLVNELKPGWSKDLDSSRRMAKSLSEGIQGAFAKMVIENGLWKEDPKLVTGLINEHNTSMVTKFLLDLKDLHERPEIMEDILVRALYGNSGVSFKRLMEVLREPEWVEHHEMVSRMFRADDMKYLDRVIDSPAWASHPELLVEYASYGSNSYLTKDLLELPHWRDHPEFASLKENGKIPYAKFWEYAHKKYPKNTGMLSGALIRCGGLFQKLRGQ